MKKDVNVKEDGTVVTNSLTMKKTAQAKCECGRKDRSLDFLSGEKYSSILVPGGVWLFLSKEEKMDLSGRNEGTQL